MKVEEAPKKIYINPLPNPSDGYVGIAWNEPHKTMVEYVRKDVFIEKACELLARMIWEVTYEDFEVNSVQHYDKIEFIEDFKKYIEGE